MYLEKVLKCKNADQFYSECNDLYRSVQFPGVNTGGLQSPSSILNSNQSTEVDQRQDKEIEEKSEPE